MKKRKFDDLIGRKNDEIQTPPEIYQRLNEIYKFDFDPCPLERAEWDGLLIAWKNCNFVNPPFSEIPKWINKALQEMKLGKKSVFLITSRISSKYWFDLIFPNLTGWWTLEGATQFPGFEGKLPTPLSVIEFDPLKKAKSKLKQNEKFVGKRRWLKLM